MRYLLTSLLTAAACLGITAAVASGRDTDNGHFRTITDGVTAYFRADDLACREASSYYGRHVVYCFRHSRPMGVNAFFTPSTLWITHGVPTSVLFRHAR